MLKLSVSKKLVLEVVPVGANLCKVHSYQPWLMLEKEWFRDVVRNSRSGHKRGRRVLLIHPLPGRSVVVDDLEL